MIGKYSRKLLDHTTESATDALKNTSKILIQKAAEVTGDLISNNIVNNTTGVSENWQQNNSETVTNEHGKKYLKKDANFLKKDRKLLLI